MTLHCTEVGSGEPMVLLHGNGEDSTYFKNQTAYFSRSYRVIAVDIRGRGKTSRGTKEFTLKQFARDLKEFFEHKKLNRAILLGFSDGGNIALIFTIMYPEHVSRLILNGANLNPFGMTIRTQLPIYAAYLAASLGALFHRPFRQKKELLGLMVLEPWIHPAKVSEIRIPVLIVVGSSDVIRVRHTRFMHWLIPDSRLCVIKGGHFIAEENSRDYNRAVAHFLKMTGAGGKNGWIRPEG